MGEELKFIDVIGGNKVAGLWTDPASKVTIVGYDNLAPIAIGTGQSERIGRQVCLKKIDIRGEFLTPPSTGTTLQAPIAVRFVLVLDKQTNGVGPVLGSSPMGATGAVTSDVYSMPNLENEQRYRILADYQILLNPAVGMGVVASTGETVWNGKQFHIKKNFGRGLLVDYKGVGAGTIDIVRNSLHLFAVQNGAANVLDINFYAQTRYVG